MTFIASVIAKNGVAVIADSLVTTSIHNIELGEFLDHLQGEAKKTKAKEIKLDPKSIIKLFKARRSYTKDFEEKLFKFDNFTAITTAGFASINSKKIEQIIDEVVNINSEDKYYNRKRILTRVKNLCAVLEKEIKLHLKQKDSIGPTSFVLSHFDKIKNETIIYKINVNSASKRSLEDENFEYVSYKKAHAWEKVVCDGQNRISERILLGTIEDIYKAIPVVVARIIKDFKLKQEDIPKDYLIKLLEDRNIVSPKLFEEMKIFKLSELSLQQAVDLASLLMRLEIDFQTYTENIPTVGGVIKLATIDKNGFKFINGDEIVKPNNI